MVSRRTVLATGLLASLPLSALAQTSEPTLLERLITEVIATGDLSGLSELVSPDVTIPDFEVTGIEAFTAASKNGHESRQERYSDYTFEIQAIAAIEGWQLAYVRLTGTTTTGQSEDAPAFYAARISDDLISELYIGQ